MTRRQSDQRTAQTSSSQGRDQEDAPEETPLVIYEGVVSFGVSVLVHSFLLLLLALFASYYSQESEPIEPVQAQMDSLPEIEPQIVEEVSFEVLKTSDDTAPRSLQQDARDVAQTSPPPMAMALFSNRSALPPVAGHGWDGNASMGLGEKLNTTMAAGKNEEADGEVDFFGTKAKGNSFVFILDCSASMTTPTNYYHPRSKARSCGLCEPGKSCISHLVSWPAIKSST